MVTLETCLGELEKIPELNGMGRYILYCDHDFLEDFQAKQMTIKDVGVIGWNPNSMCRGINLFIDEMTKGMAKSYSVYSEEECHDDEQKRNVNLIHIKPGQTDPQKPFIILVSGGAYANVCNGTEAFPTAEHFLKQGYQVFIFTYRVGGTRAVPRAIEDMAAAVRYIKNHAEELQVDPENYILTGFSAGANISATWGCRNVGYASYDLPKPKALFLIYPLVDLIALQRERDSKELKEMMKNDWDGLTIMLGEDYSEEDLHKYNVVEHVDEEYPNSYIVCGKDDVMVAPSNSVTLKQKLDESGVRSVLELGEHAPHGFGDGTGTDVEGWPGRVLDLINTLYD